MNATDLDIPDSAQARSFARPVVSSTALVALVCLLAALPPAAYAAGVPERAQVSVEGERAGAEQSVALSQRRARALHAAYSAVARSMSQAKLPLHGGVRIVDRGAGVAPTARHWHTECVRAPRVRALVRSSMIDLPPPAVV